MILYSWSFTGQVYQYKIVWKGRILSLCNLFSNSTFLSFCIKYGKRDFRVAGWAGSREVGVGSYISFTSPGFPIMPPHRKYRDSETWVLHSRKLASVFRVFSRTQISLTYCFWNIFYISRYIKKLSMKSFLLVATVSYLYLSQSLFAQAQDLPHDATLCETACLPIP